MFTPDKGEPYKHVFAQVDEILHHKKRPVVLFSFPEFKARWNSYSVAEQYFYKGVISVFGGAGITAALALLRTPDNILMGIPCVAGLALMRYYFYRARQEVKRQL